MLYPSEAPRKSFERILTPLRGIERDVPLGVDDLAQLRNLFL
jgi:hypothetical protein